MPQQDIGIERLVIDIVQPGGVKVTPENVVSAVELLKRDKAEMYLDDRGYLWVRPAS